tara:strand:- start:343 stop:591 length:249 start_codon:yes stop_codon:yes gene_type:complete
MIDLDRVARICFYILTGGTLVLASHMMTMRYALAELHQIQAMAHTGQPTTVVVGPEFPLPRLNSPDSLAYCIQMVEEMKRDN